MGCRLLTGTLTLFMQIKPTNSNIFFTLHDAKTSDLQLIADKPICPFGRVVAVDPSLYLDADGFPVRNPAIVVGSRIIINPHACTKLPTELGDLFVCPASAVYGVYSGEPESTITLN